MLPPIFPAVHDHLRSELGDTLRNASQEQSRQFEELKDAIRMLAEKQKKMEMGQKKLETGQKKLQTDHGKQIKDLRE